MKERLLNAATIVVTALALFLGGQHVWRYVSPLLEPTQTVANWREIGEVGLRIGPADARVVVVEFADYQCPFCRMAAFDLENLRARYSNDLAIVHRHFPLSFHAEAERAAIAAECAARQGRFPELHLILYAQADSLGRRPWRTLASEAGVPDLNTFHNCMLAEEPAAAIERDLSVVAALGLRGTPTFLINDRLVPQYPGTEALQRQVEEALQNAR